MATINGYTAARMQDIEDNAFVDASLVNYELILEKFDGSTVNLGNVRGATGATGATGPQGPAGSSGYVICTSATRPSSPTVGQNIYETDTGKHLVYYGATTQWQPPWNQAWGVVAWFSNTTQGLSFNTTPTVISGLTGSVTTVNNRNYELTFQCRFLNTVQWAVNNWVIRRNSSSVLNGIQQNASNTADQTFTLTGLHQATSTSTVTWDVQCYNNQGTTNLYGGNGLTQLVIKDVGSLYSAPTS
jgi:hypothetical protein